MDGLTDGVRVRCWSGWWMLQMWVFKASCISIHMLIFLRTRNHHYPHQLLLIRVITWLDKVKRSNDRRGTCGSEQRR